MTYISYNLNSSCRLLFIYNVLTRVTTNHIKKQKYFKIYIDVHNFVYFPCCKEEGS